jgi:hypothetical protein
MAQSNPPSYQGAANNNNNYPAQPAMQQQQQPVNNNNYNYPVQPQMQQQQQQPQMQYQQQPQMQAVTLAYATPMNVPFVQMGTTTGYVYRQPATTVYVACNKLFIH